MNRRIKILKYTIIKKTFGGPIKAWLLTCFGPTCDILAKRYIKEMDETDEYIRIKLLGCDESLFVSKSIPLHSL